MMIEIHEPELENLVQQEIMSGNFQSVDDLLTQAIRALREKSPNAVQIPTRRLARTRAEAVAHIREARKGNRLPEGMTIRDLVNLGRP